MSLPADLQSWLDWGQHVDAQAWTWLNLPQTPRARLHFRRDGVTAIFERLEDLKLLTEGALQHHVDVQRALGLAKARMVDIRGTVDDSMDVGRIPGMVSRGLAWDERRVMHDTSALEPVMWRRRFETLTEQLTATERALRSVMDVLRAERIDLGAQSRLIQVAAEVGEI